MLVNDNLNLRNTLAFQDYLTSLRQPAQNIETVGVHGTITTRHRSQSAGIRARQIERQVNDKGLQTGAIAKGESDNLGEALEDLGVVWYFEFDALDVSSAALV